MCPHWQLYNKYDKTSLVHCMIKHQNVALIHPKKYSAYHVLLSYIKALHLTYMLLTNRLTKPELIYVNGNCHLCKRKGVRLDQVLALTVKGQVNIERQFLISMRIMTWWGKWVPRKMLNNTCLKRYSLWFIVSLLLYCVLEAQESFYQCTSLPFICCKWTM